MRKILLFVLCCTSLLAADHVRVDLMLPQSLRGGDKNIAELRMEHAHGWHTYGPAELGATTLTWTLPPGWSTAPAQWPNEENFELQGISSWGYSGGMEVRVPIVVPSDTKQGEYPIGLKVTWVVCGEGMCVPGEKEFVATVRVGGHGQGWIFAHPKNPPSSNAQTQPVTPELKKAVVAITKQGRTISETTKIATTQAIQKPAHTEVGKTLTAQAMLSHDDSNNDDNDQTMIEATEAGTNPIVVAPPAISKPGLPAKTTKAHLSLKLLSAAFVGGLILNLMPCVFPILGIKILSFVKHAGGDKKAIAWEAGAYGLGILFSAVALGTSIIVLRHAGMAVGWGFHLQDARIVWAIVALLGLLAMNMAGGWCLPSIGGDALVKAGSVGGWLGAFLAGALMVAVATPCSAPFLALAIGQVFVLPAWQALGLMALMGIGMATPYWLLAVAPEAVRWLPKPGKWMEDLKMILAWVMAAAAVFEAWVYVGQVAPEVSLAGLMGILILLMGAWAFARWRLWGRTLGLLLIVTGLWIGIHPVEQKVTWENWSPTHVAELQKEHRLIVVDFTARWCVNCLINDKVVWTNPEILNLLRDKHAALLRADWTSRDETIATELMHRGKSAIPLVVIYKDGAPADGIELQNLLTVKQVEKVLK